MENVEVVKTIEAPLEQVWSRYTDHASWTRWAGLGKVRLAKEGVPPPNGVGCVRVFTASGLHEEVTRFDAPRRMTYRIVKGIVPIKDHLGDVTFEADGNGTRIVWRCQFNSRIPGLGGLFRRFITGIFRRGLDGLEKTFR